MVNYIRSTPQQTDSLSLLEAYQGFKISHQEEIPWIVKFFENPASPFALPGRIYLHDHDCLHILLNRGTHNRDEAFVIGFTMGNDMQIKPFHVQIFKFVSRFLYPPIYRFNRKDLKIFDLGFMYGKRLKVKNLNQLDFSIYYSMTIQELRQSLDISVDELASLEQFEQWLFSQY